MKPMDHAEKVAKLIVETAIPGALMTFRCEQSNVEYDFSLDRPNCEAAAVEATSSRNQFKALINAKIFDKKRGGPIIPAVKCKKTWIIFPIADPRIDKNIDKIRMKADEYLARLEEDGLEEFDILRKHCSPESVRKICDDLNLRWGTVLGSADGSPEIYINGVGGSGAYSANTAIRAGEKEAQENKKKLGKSGAHERHLVVYVDQRSNGLACEALRIFDPPRTLPNLPEEITHIWLATEYEKVDRFVVWFGSKTEFWQKIVISAEEHPRIRHIAKTVC